MDPFRNAQGGTILKYILTLAEDNKSKLSFILTGYEKDIKEKLLVYDPGLASRFPSKYYVLFEDYNKHELTEIFRLYLSKQPHARNGKKLSVSPEIAAALGRRLARNAKSRGFGNARDVENRLTGILSRWRARIVPDVANLPVATAENHRLTLTDVMGERPSVDKGPAGQILRELHGMVGLDSVKEEFRALVERMQVFYDEDVKDRPQTNAGLLNRVFQGPPGTGKTTVAMLYGRLLSACGFLSDGEVVRALPSDLVGAVQGESEQKTANLLESCRGKVLFIDEAYGLAKKNEYYTAIVDTVVGTIPEKGGSDMAVVLAGYTDDMRSMFDAVNAGLNRRFPDPHCRFTFEAYNESQLRQIFMDAAIKKKMLVDFAAAEEVSSALVAESQRRNFGNASAALEFLDRVQRFKTRAVGEAAPSLAAAASGDAEAQKRMVSKQDVVDMIAEERNKEDAESGVVGIKLHKDLQAYVIKQVLGVATARALRRPPPELLHLRLMGPPGTGKTTCAKVLGRELFYGGVLPTRRVVICSAEELQAKYTGQVRFHARGPAFHFSLPHLVPSPPLPSQSADKMKEKIIEAMGGILFIDEAPRLAGSAQGDFKKEIVGTLLAAMTSAEYKSKLLVIVAGYKEEMDTFIQSDPGLLGRFNEAIELESLEPAELLAYLKRFLRSPKFLDCGTRDPWEAQAPPASLGGGAGSSAAPPPLQSIDDFLLDWFAVYKALLGGQFRNIGNVEMLAANIHAQTALSFQERAIFECDAAEEGMANPAVLRRFSDLMTSWGKAYSEANVRAACEAMLTTAKKDAVTRRIVEEKKAREKAESAGKALNPAAGAGGEGLGQEAAATATASAQAQAAAGGAPPPNPRKAAAKAALKEKLLRIVGAAVGQLGQCANAGDAAKFTEVLSDCECEAKEDILAQLRAENEQADEALRMAAGELQAVYSEAIAKANSAINDMVVAGAARMADLARQAQDARARALQNDVTDLLALDGNMRRLTEHEVRTDIMKRVCNLCKRADDPYSGCAFGGFSPFAKTVKVGEKVTLEKTYAQTLGR